MLTLLGWQEVALWQESDMTESVFGWTVVGALSATLHFLITVSFRRRFAHKVLEHLVAFMALVGLVAVVAWWFDVPYWEYIFMTVLVTSAWVGMLGGMGVWLVGFGLRKPHVGRTPSHRANITVGGSFPTETRRSLFGEDVIRHDKHGRFLLAKPATGHPVRYVESEGQRYVRAVEATDRTPLAQNQPELTLEQMIALYKKASGPDDPKPGGNGDIIV